MIVSPIVRALCRKLADEGICTLYVIADYHTAVASPQFLALVSRPCSSQQKSSSRPYRIFVGAAPQVRGSPSGLTSGRAVAQLWSRAFHNRLGIDQGGNAGNRSDPKVEAHKNDPGPLQL